MSGPIVPVSSILESDDTGFACNRDRLVSDGIPHLRPFNIGENGQLELSELYRAPTNLAPLDKRELIAGDILFNVTNSAALVGKAAIVRDQIAATYSNHVARLRVDRKSVSPEWFAFWLSHQRSLGYFKAQATQWVSQATFRTSQLRSMSIRLPSMSEQRRIVDLLSRAESIVRMRREAEAKAREIIPALFVDMFGDPATNPRGWEVRPLGEIGSLDRGRSRHRPRDAAHLYGGPYPFVQTGDVTRSGGAITMYSQTYSKAGLAQSKLWRAGTLCITIAANIAETGILGFDACFPDSVVGFLPGTAVRTEYVQEWLRFLQPTLAAQAPQAAQKNINLAILKSLKVPVPRIEVQDTFVARVRSLREAEVSHHSATATAVRAFQSLLAGVFEEGERQ